MTIVPYLKIIRLSNAAMASGAVFLGSWISSAPLLPINSIILAAVAFFATAFGNIINDLIDIESDRINHPSRPLPQGDIKPVHALCFGLFTAAAALFGAFYVKPLYGIATLVPLLLLVCYALFFKGTPLFGNILVSLLVAYAILFGSLEAPRINHLVIPSVSAMLLNLSREIVKDIQDVSGDQSSGIVTTAILPDTLLKWLLYCQSLLSALLLYVPFILGHFGFIFVGCVTVFTVPLHLKCFIILIKKDWTLQGARLSTLYKLEMLSGLAALAADHIIRVYSGLNLSG